MPFRIRILEDGTEKGELAEMEMQTFLVSLDEEQWFIFEERAAIMEFEGGLTRTEAEKGARACILRILEEAVERGKTFSEYFYDLIELGRERTKEEDVKQGSENEMATVKQR